jgi:hypothetical protein
MQNTNPQWIVAPEEKIKICPFGAEVFYTDGRKGWRTDKRADRQIDKHNEPNGLFSQCERA